MKGGATNNRKLKYAVHGGWITSLQDGERHFIPASIVAELYCLKRGEWFEWDYESRMGCDESDFVHLTPQSSGNYFAMTTRRKTLK